MQDTTAATRTPPETWVGLSAASHIATLSANAIHRAGKRGDIRTKHLAGRTLYHRASVEKYAEKRRKQAA